MVFQLIPVNHHFLVYSLVHSDWWFPIWWKDCWAHQTQHYLTMQQLQTNCSGSASPSSHLPCFLTDSFSDAKAVEWHAIGILCFISMTVLMYVNKRFSCQPSTTLTFWITSNPIWFLQGLIKAACMPINPEMPSAPWRKFPLRHCYLHVISRAAFSSNQAQQFWQCSLCTDQSKRTRGQAINNHKMKD